VATGGDDVALLVERAKASDPNAWEALYRRVYPGLLAYARRRLDADRARDAVAETMARAVAGLDRFAWNGAGFEAWMYGILRHVVIDAHRAHARRRGEPLDHGDGAGPLEYVLDGEEAAALRSAFDLLDPADRELLELRVVAGLSAEEVGSVLSKRPGAVRMAQSRALERLRRELERQG
jgi:RNA polymerase sigma-70 factor (ECF subfamily)